MGGPAFLLPQASGSDDRGDMKGPPDSQFTVLSLSFQVCLVLLREVTVYSGVSGPPPKTQNARCPFGDLTARTLLSV